MKYLLIGGCADGEWHDTQDSRDWNVSKQSEPQWGLDDKIPDRVPYSRYRRVKFVAGGSKTFIYLCTDIIKNARSEEDVSELALHALIAGYQRKPDTPPAPRQRPDTGIYEMYDYQKKIVKEMLDPYAPSPDEIDARLEREAKRAPPRAMGIDLGRLSNPQSYSYSEVAALLEILEMPGAMQEMEAMFGPVLMAEIKKSLAEQDTKSKAAKPRGNPTDGYDYLKHDPTKRKPK